MNTERTNVRKNNVKGRLYMMDQSGIDMIRTLILEVKSIKELQKRK